MDTVSSYLHEINGRVRVDEAQVCVHRARLATQRRAHDLPAHNICRLFKYLL